MHLKSRAVHPSTGVNLQYVEQGHRSGVPVLLLHAYLDSWRSFERVLEHLPDELHALAPAVQEIGKAIAALTDPVDPDFVRDFVAGTAGDGVSPDFLDTMVAESRKVPAHVWREMLDGLVGGPPLGGTIDAPTLILWGDADPICSRAEQEALLDAIPLAELRTYPGVGHLVHWEQPERVAADIAGFADRSYRAPA